MSRKLILPILILVIIVGAIASYVFLNKNGISGVLVSATSSTTPIRVPLTLYSDFEKSETNVSKSAPFINSQSHDVVSFQALTDDAHRAQNPSYNVVVNNKVIGEISGMGINAATFSPNNLYFAFQVQSVCGATCNSISLYVIDLKTLTLKTILPPVRGNERDATTTQYQDGIGMPVISSYSWGTSDTLEITFFFVGIDSTTQNPYRISAEQIWNYDLNTGKYSVAQTLPER